MAASGVLAIPGVGAAAEVGFLLGNTLLGSGIGAAGGGLVGALIGWGVPEERANYYNDRVYNENDYLVMVEGTEAEIRAAEAVLQEGGHPRLGRLWLDHNPDLCPQPLRFEHILSFPRPSSSELAGIFVANFGYGLAGYIQPIGLV